MAKFDDSDEVLRDIAQGLTDDELNVDADAVVSRGDEGAWVAAWVWVPFELEGDDE